MAGNYRRKIQPSVTSEIKAEDDPKEPSKEDLLKQICFDMDSFAVMLKYDAENLYTKENIIKYLQQKANEIFELVK